MPPPPSKFERDLALKGSDADVYPYLSLYKQTVYERNHRGDDFLVELRVGLPALDENYEKRPEVLPFTRGYVQELVTEDRDLYKGRWSVAWSSEHPRRSDVIYNDGFRSLFFYKTIEFMIRPVNMDEGPKRLHFGSKDITHCLRAALDANPPNPDDESDEMMTVIGRGLVKDPESSRKNPKPNVPFQWRIDRADENKVAQEVWNWKIHRFPEGHRPTANYLKEKKAYDSEFLVMEAPTQSSQYGGDPGEGSSSGHKRSARPYSPSEAGPSYKRRSTESHPGAMGGPQYPSQGSSSSRYMPPPPVPHSGRNIPSTSALTQSMEAMTITSSSGYGQFRPGGAPALPRGYDRSRILPLPVQNQYGTGGYLYPQPQQYSPGPLPPPQGWSGPSYASSSGPTYTQLGMSHEQFEEMARDTEEEIRQGRGHIPPQPPYYEDYEGGYPPSSS